MAMRFIQNEYIPPVFRISMLLALVLIAALPAVANAAECANEARRVEQGTTFLPECRAYEMVTPPYKSDNMVVPVSTGAGDGEGEALIGGSDGAFGGAESENSAESQGSNIVLMRRGVEDWSTRSINPPSPEFSAQEFVYADPELGISLWRSHAPNQSKITNELYIRREAEPRMNGGADMTEVGPLIPLELAKGPLGEEFPPSGLIIAPQHLEVRGASADFGHIVFSIEANSIGSSYQWQGDGTLGGQSLYEYTGVGNTKPTLVGVNASGELIGECGVYLGGAGSAYNAISVEGKTIFFTPTPANIASCEARQPSAAEIYARIDGMRTVDVSESECTPGECEGQPAADSNFAGATENGTKVFFTSTQRLLDGATEDAGDSASVTKGKGCRRAKSAGGCNLYEYDFEAEAGHNLSLIAGGSEVLGVARISEGGQYVYFVAKGKLTAEEDPWLTEGHRTAVAGEDNLYAFDTSTRETHFIATLAPQDEADWQLEDRRPVDATPDGSHIVFPSILPLTPDDHSIEEAPQLFEYDATTKELTRISIGEAGYDEDGNVTAFQTEQEFDEYSSFVADRNLNYLATSFHQAAQSSKFISNDGSTIVFESPAPLSPMSLAAEVGCTSVYVYHSSGAIRTGGVHLVSDGLDIAKSGSAFCGATFVGMGATGRDILFSTADTLLPSDVEGQRDIYDARIDGGFPIPPTQPMECSGEACHGPLAMTPSLPEAQSLLQAAGENAAAVSQVEDRIKVLEHAVNGRVVTIRVAVPAAGQLSIVGGGVVGVRSSVGSAGLYTFRVPLTARERRVVGRRHETRFSISIKFTPSQGGGSSAKISITARH
jgi:hypothetical protein